MEEKLTWSLLVLVLAAGSSPAQAVNNAPADVDTVTLRASCFENGGAVEIPNCFTSMDDVDVWLKNVRLTGPDKPTLVEVGPGVFTGWLCSSSNVTLRGSGRDRTVFGIRPGTFGAAITITHGCTDLNVQDMTIDGTLDPSGQGEVTSRGVDVITPETPRTSWTNVEIIGTNYGWLDSGAGACTSNTGKHMFFSSRIRAGTPGGGVVRAYSARCAQAWFWGSEISADQMVSNGSAFALEARDAEIHIYGSNASVKIHENTNAQGYRVLANGGIGGHYLIAALQGSEVHIHGTGLDVIHKGSGVVDMLYADASSGTHFHSTASAFNIHVTGAGTVRRLAGPGSIDAPYAWGQRAVPPLSTAQSGMETLISRNGADTYVETDCPADSHCDDPAVPAQDKTFPHEMVYRAECDDTSPSGGPWYDMSTKACRQ